MNTLKLALAGLTLASLQGLAAAAVVTPVSYTFDQATSCGTWCNYHDPSFSKLTDGQVGYLGWAADQGQSWVGWVYTPVVNIDFNFGQVRSISDVTLYTTQDNLGDVVLPSLKVWQKVGTDWVAVGGLKIKPSAANDHDPFDQKEEALSFGLTDLDIQSQYVRISLSRNGPWIFASEVKFEQAAAVPEAGSIAMALAGVAVSGLMVRRRRAA